MGELGPGGPAGATWRPARAARRALARLLHALAFCAGFAVACALLTRLVTPAPAAASRRVEWLRAHGAAYDTVFVGSSRTARQVVPAVFDAEMAALGEPTRSFNLAAPGMRPPEDGYVLERALSGRSAPLRFVVAECNEVRLDIPPGDAGTTREVYWHDAARVAVLWRRVFAPEVVAQGARLSRKIVRRNLGEFVRHLPYWAWNAARLGRGPELLRDALVEPGPDPDRLALGPAGDGYVPGRARPPLAGRDLARYLRGLEAAQAREPRAAYADTESQRELARKRDLAARHGARLVLVAPPLLGGTLAPLPELGVPYLDFSDPRRFPELFVPEHRTDSGHVNAAGAEIYSRLLARGLVAALHQDT